MEVTLTKENQEKIKGKWITTNMKAKVEKLLAEKIKAKKQLNLEYDNEEYTSRFIEQSYAEEYDRLVTEIKLLKFLLKD